MNIVLAIMAQSPFSRSIWMGLAHGFQAHGCHVQVVQGDALPVPAKLPSRPDMLFAVHGRIVSGEMVARYRAAGIPTAVYLLDEPYEVDASTMWARPFEWVFTVDRATVPVHAQFSHARHLPLGYDDAIFHPGMPMISSDILVLGSPFQAREDFLRPIIDGFGSRVTWVGPGWRELTALGRHSAGVVPPEGCAAYYRGAKIVINIHRDSSWSHFGELNKARIEATHLNPRFWEAGACGAFQLVSYRSDLDAYAQEAVSFRTPEELTQLVSKYLDNEGARTVSATATLKRLALHSYRLRAREVMDLVSR
jgi:spore maturation protein CgeB